MSEAENSSELEPYLIETVVKAYATGKFELSVKSIFNDREFKFTCCIFSIFKNLDCILQGDVQLDPKTFDLTSEVTMDDITKRAIMFNAESLFT